MRHLFPWPQPTSVWADDGPAEPMSFLLFGAEMRVSPTDRTGLHSGRKIFVVECLTCGEVVHEGTTSASIRCERHLKEKHGGRS